MKLKTVAVIQARMGSRRLPGKVLHLLAGQSVLSHVVRRVQNAATVDEVLVATSHLESDNAIAEACGPLGVRCVRGSESDVLSRYALAAAQAQAEVVVRVTADCPLVSAAVIDEIVAARALENADYASNTLQRGFPQGLDVECCRRFVLDIAKREATAPEEREHVTPFLYNRPSRFALTSRVPDEDWSWIRWTIDTPVDLEYLNALLVSVPYAGALTTEWRELALAVKGSPSLRELNARAIASAGERPSSIPLR